MERDLGDLKEGDSKSEILAFFQEHELEYVWDRLSSRWIATKPESANELRTVQVHVYVDDGGNVVRAETHIIYNGL